MTAPSCSRCHGTREVPLYAGLGVTACPRCTPRPVPASVGPIPEGGALLVGTGGPPQIIADPEARLVAGLKVTSVRVDAIDAVLAACRAHRLTPGEWLRKARRALNEGSS